MGQSEEPMAESLDREQGFAYFAWLSGYQETRDVMAGLMKARYRPDPEKLRAFDEIIERFLATHPEPEGAGEPFGRVYARLDRGPDTERFPAFVRWLEEKGAMRPGEVVDHKSERAPYCWAWHVLRRMLRGGEAFSTRADAD